MRHEACVKKRNGLRVAINTNAYRNRQSLPARVQRYYGYTWNYSHTMGSSWITQGTMGFAA